jgi:hypothetical protein
VKFQEVVRGEVEAGGRRFKIKRVVRTVLFFENRRLVQDDGLRKERFS